MKISIVGTGMGNQALLTLGGLAAIQDADLLIGAQRLIAAYPQKKTASEIYSDQILKVIENNQDLAQITIIMSGDTGFYSGTKKLLPLLEGYTVEVMPGISSMQYMAAKIGRPWQDATLVSAHGVQCNLLGTIMQHQEVFFLTGGQISPMDIIQTLIEAGLEDTKVYVGENMSYDNEKITQGTAATLSEQVFETLSVIWIVRKAFNGDHAYRGGIEDEAFIRGKVPMTKQTVRGAIIAALQVKDDEVIYDIGAGTGSIGIETALMNVTTHIYAIETNPEGIALIQENREKFSAYNLTVIEGKAPEALKDLPVPDRAFIGGSKGNLKEIVTLLREKNPTVKIVVSAIALETLKEATDVLPEADVRMITVAKARTIGRYHMMTGENPIYIIATKEEA